jgi:hypothetical protein
MQSHLRCIGVALALLAAAGLPAAAPPTSRVAALLNDLDDDAFDTRQQADDALRAMGPAVLPTLKDELARSSSPEVRFRLSRMVRDLGLGDHIARMVRRLGADNPQGVAKAEEALRQAGAGALPLLRKELQPTLDARRRKRLEKIIAELSAH